MLASGDRVPSRRLLAARALAAGLVAATALFASAPAARGAPPPTRWCGADEATADRLPDAVASYQVHVVYAIPSDGTDRYFERALPIARDLAAIDSWWRLQDPTRTPRFDLEAFPGCDSAFGGLDISFLRLPRTGAAYAAITRGGYEALAGDVAEAFSDRYKKYVVYYDGPLAPGEDVCGASSDGPPDRGASFAFTFVDADPTDGFCGTLGSSDYMSVTAVHELIHNLGAVEPQAPHQCEGGHVCDAPGDIMRSSGSSNSLFDYALDVGRDDYYGHSGTWWDVQDSPWLSHLDAPQFALSVTVSDPGLGSVQSDLPGISCPPACSIAWDGGTPVTLAAQAKGDRSRFSGWSGACSGEAACTVTMDAAKAVRATFVRQVSLAVTVAARGGTGRVTSAGGLDCARGACRALVDSGSRLLLTAAPARGSRLVGWSIPSCRALLTCSFTPSADMSVVATFGPAAYRLTAQITGRGRVVSTPPGLSCTSRCSASFPYAKQVRLLARPAPGWRFAGWSGSCRGAGRCVVGVTKSSSVRATFRPAPGA
jgi:hypothetical protein